MIALFVLKLTVGITLMWWLMPRQEVTDGFFRIQMRVVLGLAVLAALLLSRGGTWNVGSATEDDAAAVMLESTRTWQFRIEIAVGIFCYAGSVLWAIGRRVPGTVCIYSLVAATSLALLLHSWRVPRVNTGLQLFSDFSSAAVVGSVLTGMLLGHWYLTTPTMSIRPLHWFTVVIAASGVLRLIASTAAVFAGSLDLPSMTHWMWLSMRWTGSIVVPLLVACSVWRILRYRNTQSATGVLFAGLILVLMAEMSASLLERDLQIPY